MTDFVDWRGFDYQHATVQLWVFKKSATDANPTSTQPSAPMVLRVNDLLEWMLVQAVAGKITIAPELVDGGSQQ